MIPLVVRVGDLLADLSGFEGVFRRAGRDTPELVGVRADGSVCVIAAESFPGGVVQAVDEIAHALRHEIGFIKLPGCRVATPADEAGVEAVPFLALRRDPSETPESDIHGVVGREVKSVSVRGEVVILRFV